MGSGDSSPSDDHDYARQTPSSNRRCDSARPDHGALVKSDQVLACEAGGPPDDFGDARTVALHVRKCPHLGLVVLHELTLRSKIPGTVIDHSWANKPTTGHFNNR